MRCVIGDKPTTGSTGAAGIKWDDICQPCKDREDKALLSRVQYESKVMDLIMEGLK